MNSMKDTERSSTQTSTGKQNTTSNQGKQEQRDNHDNANHNASCFQKNGGTAKQQQTRGANSKAKQNTRRCSATSQHS